MRNHSPRRPWTDELGRIRCRLWWNSHLLQLRESFLGWRKCPWTVSPSVPVEDNAEHFNPLLLKPFARRNKRSCLRMFWSSKVRPLYHENKATSPNGTGSTPKHLYQTLQADFRGKRNNRLAAGMHFRVFEPKSQLKRVKTSLSEWPLISITGPVNICQCQLQWGTLHSLTDLKKLIKYRREMAHYGQSSSELLGARTLPLTDSMGRTGKLDWTWVLM